MAEVCTECGSKVSYRQEEVTTAEDESRRFMKVPYACANSQCLNADPRHHDFEWFTTVGGHA